MSNSIRLKTWEERSHRSQDKGKGDVRQWFEILVVDDTLVLLLGKPHGVHNLLNIFVPVKALPVSLCSTHDLEKVIRVAYM
jgi:hypothetical protein